jgi:hypothetical protein
MKRILYVIGILTGITLFVIVISLMFNNNTEDNYPDNRFISYDNGTVLDTKTGLMWAVYDNGTSTTWQEAKEYCEQYSGGGYTDWRMPTVDLTNKIHLTGCSVWTLEDHGAEAECFLFDYGRPSLMFKSINFIMRALPIREGHIY